MPLPTPTLQFEKVQWKRGLAHVAGVDEVGRGAWAGPVVAGAVVLPRERQRSLLRLLDGVRDSKLLTPLRREELVAPICDCALAQATGLATREEIDWLGIVPATRLAMQRAIQALAQPPDSLLIDALRLPQYSLPQKAIIHGDQVSLSIACASIIAKVTRDRLMVAMDAELPGYAFAQHKGYGTRDHQEALERLGACREHRTSFRPIKDLSTLRPSP